MNRGALAVRAGWLVLLGGLLQVGALQAAADCPALVQAREAHRQLDYDRVTPLLRQALTQPCSDADRAETYELLALMHVTYNRDDEAIEAFSQLLTLSPDYAPPDGSSPKIRAAFEQARAQRAPAPPPSPAPPTAPPAPQPETAAASTPTATPAPPPQDAALTWLWIGLGTATGAAVLATAGLVTWSLLQSATLTADFGPYPL